jgi:hypothetical protein
MSRVFSLDSLEDKYHISNDLKGQLDLLGKSENDVLIIGEEGITNDILSVLTCIRREPNTKLFVLNDKIEIEFGTQFPHDYITSLNVKDNMSYLDVRGIIKSNWSVGDRLVISGVDSKSLVEYYRVCCEGLIPNVLATYVYEGNLVNAVLSFISLQKSDDSKDLSSFELRRVVEALNNVVFCKKVDNGYSIELLQTNDLIEFLEL